MGDQFVKSAGESEKVDEGRQVCMWEQHLEDEGVATVQRRGRGEERRERKSGF